LTGGHKYVGLWARREGDDMPRHPTIIRRMIQSRLRKLSEVEQLVAATLVETQLRCAKSGCRICAKGGGHPTRFLTFKRGGKTVTVYVPKDDLEEVRQWVGEHKRVKVLVREISALSVELMKARTGIRREQKRRRRRS